MRSVLITGTSTGIGRATAVVLASRGWRLFATMRNVEKRSLLEPALKGADVQNGVDIEQLDVLSQASIQAAAGSMLSYTTPAWCPRARTGRCRSMALSSSLMSLRRRDSAQPRPSCSRI
jgi:NAD(P)-dependent dehydrogenase (short-subunit alcohol dehydrogenase family)